MRGTWLVGAFVAVFAAGSTPAWAQDSRQPSGSATSSGGSAVSRDSGSSGGGSSGGGSSGGGSSAASGGSSSPGAPSSGDSSIRTRNEYFAAPSHPSERQQSRQRGEGDSRQPRGGSDGSGGRAVPRGGSDSSPTSGTSRDSGASASSGESNAPSRRAVPAYSRPREGRTQTGTAVERSAIGGGNTGFIYRPFGSGSAFYRSPYRLYYVPGGYGFGLGYFYDPVWYDPYGYDPYGYGYGYGAGGGYYAGSGRASYDRAPTGSLRLKIKPREAQVYVDGYFVGEVDDFDGTFQKLAIDAGGHRIEIRSQGYEPTQFDVLITPGETVTYKGELKRQ